MSGLYFERYWQQVGDITLHNEIKLREDYITTLEHKVETLSQELTQSRRNFLSCSRLQQDRANFLERDRDEWRAQANLAQHHMKAWQRLLPACPRCAGRGVVSTQPLDHEGEMKYTLCPICGGTGKEPA